MLRLISLLLPALIPSWRFFKTVAPSPRIEYRLIHDAQLGRWSEDRKRPAWVGPALMLRRLLWNPGWNEKLYLVSLSERLIAQEAEHSVREINRLIAARLNNPAQDAHLQFRLVFVLREKGTLHRSVQYESWPVPLSEVR